MTFWAYMIQCADRHFYAGHTDNLEQRIGQHQAGTVPGYTRTRRPVHLVWSQEFPSRYEALQAERQIKGWSRAKKLALIRGDWDLISDLVRNRQGQGRASTGSARTVWERVADHFLHPHAAQIPSEPFSLEVAIRRASGRLHLRYRLKGDLAILRIPTPSEQARRDNLWQHTCFEVFAAIDDGYLEFNFSPSTEWAAYCFSGYREGMSKPELAAPKITVSAADRALELTADVMLPETALCLGLSAVIEERDGTKSYWALRHPPGDRPDFHHPDCFALELPPASDA